ncbi:MAG TPA: electron transfer flavoprotein subunit beta/FixA family protein [Pantanalinema sp.]
MAGYHIVVTVKQVPDTTDVKLDPRTGVLARDTIKGIINPEDKHALELALGLKGAEGRVTVLSMGPETARDALKEALAMGADAAYLVSDPQAAGSDALATARVLKAALDKLEPADVVLTGRRSIDGWTGAVAPMVAELSARPLVSAIRSATLSDGKLVAEQEWQGAYQQVESPLPVVASVTREAKTPRLATAMGIMKAAKKPLTTWSLADLGVEAQAVGLSGALTKVVRVARVGK